MRVAAVCLSALAVDSPGACAHVCSRLPAPLAGAGETFATQSISGRRPSLFRSSSFVVPDYAQPTHTHTHTQLSPSPPPPARVLLGAWRTFLTSASLSSLSACLPCPPCPEPAPSQLPPPPAPSAAIKNKKTCGVTGEDRNTLVRRPPPEATKPNAWSAWPLHPWLLPVRHARQPSTAAARASSLTHTHTPFSHPDPFARPGPVRDRRLPLISPLRELGPPTRTSALIFCCSSLATLTLRPLDDPDHPPNPHRI